MSDLPPELKRIGMALSVEAKALLDKVWAERDVVRYAQPIKITSQYILMSDGTRVTKAKLINALVPEFEKMGFFFLSKEERAVFIATFNHRQLTEWEKVAEQERKEKIKMKLEEKVQSGAFTAEELQVVRNVSAFNDLTVVHEKKDGRLIRVVDLDPLSVIEAKNIVAKLEKEPPYDPHFAKVGYSPWEHPTIFKYLDSEGREHTVRFVNSFRPAHWQELPPLLPDPPIEIPELFQRFFDHLFKDEVSLEATLAWVHRMLWGGTMNALVLNGAKGIGKNLFVEILRGLVGPHNFRNAKRSLLESQFNLDLKDCLCLFLDEVPIKTQDQMANFKSYCNPVLQLEGKGIEAKEYKTYKSIVLNNNAPNDIKIEWDDRRFTVPDLTDEKLTTGWTDEEIRELAAYIQDVEGDHYYELGYYVKYMALTERYDINYCHKGKRFSEMVLASLTPWQSVLRKKILAQYANEESLGRFRQDGISLSSIISGSGLKEGWPTDTATIESFLKNFTEKRFRLGELALKAPEEALDKQADEYFVYPVGYAPKEVDIDFDNIFDIM